MNLEAAMQGISRFTRRRTPWRPWFSFSLGVKVLLPVLLACFCSALLLVGLFSWQMTQQAYEDLESRLDAFATSKAAELAGPVWNFREDMVRRLMQSYAHNEDLLRAALLDRDGAVLLEVAGSPDSAYSETRSTSRELTYESGDSTYSLGRLNVSYHDGRVHRLLERRLMENAVVVVLVLLVLALSIWLSLHCIVGRPLLRLQRSMAENLKRPKMRPLQWTSNDELGDAVRAYNDLIGEVESQKKSLESMNDVLREEAQQRQKAEHDLQLAARIFDLSIEGIAIADESGTIRNVNASFEAITGYSAQEAAGRNLRELKSGMGDEEARQAIWQRVASHGHWSGEIWSSRRTGEAYAEWLTIFRMDDEEGQASYQVAVFHEITQRKRAEQALLRSRDDFERQVAMRTSELRQANDKLKEMDRLRTAFLSSASHELRTPLTSVLGFVKLVRRDMASISSDLQKARKNGYLNRFDTSGQDKSERVLHNLGIIEHEGCRLTRLIDDLLDLNKIESGRMEWRDAPLDPAEAVRSAIQAMGLAESCSGLRFSQHIEQSLPTLHMDADRFRQVMFNLLGNAVKFTPQGDVEVRVSQPTAGVVRVSVSDSGMGIPEENLERIFQRFFQGNGQDRDKPKGTGLGLSICKNIVEHYQGRIWAESSPGHGSTFHFELPAAGACCGQPLGGLSPPARTAETAAPRPGAP